MYSTVSAKIGLGTFIVVWLSKWTPFSSSSTPKEPRLGALFRHRSAAEMAGDIEQIDQAMR